MIQFSNTCEIDAFARALDIGCSGNSFIHFLPEVKHRVLCDLAHSPLLQYQSFARYHSVCGSITDLPFESNSFDLIAALDVLEHIPNDSAARSELIRVLAPKGLLIITVPHRMAFYTKQDRIVGHVRCYEYTQIKDLFCSQGLRELEVFPVLWTIYALTICPRSESTKNRRKLNPITLPICRRSDVPKLLVPICSARGTSNENGCPFPTLLTDNGYLFNFQKKIEMIGYVRTIRYLQ